MKNGNGKHINLSQVECMLPLASPFLIEQSVCGFTRPRQGNSHPLYAPHNIYRCSGDDQWIVLSVLNNEQWSALVSLIQSPQLMNDPTLLNVAQRHMQLEKINAVIHSWTVLRSAHECMNKLQQAGICAGVVKPVWEVQEDIHLRSRGVFTNIYREHIGEYLATTAVFRESDLPMKIIRSAPTLGEHSREVFNRVLGLSEEQFFKLEEKGITGTQATIKRPSAFGG
jgi:crotonobetainyl-CoA:carnitine CoA-transferase CaiB-like acyl-CoA transferase